MKVRAKYLGVSRPIEVDNEQCTLSVLLQKTAEVFLLDESTFKLSLNKSEALVGDDQTLEQLGIIHGDLLFVLVDCLEPEAAGDSNNSGNGTRCHAVSTSGPSQVLNGLLGASGTAGGDALVHHNRQVDDRNGNVDDRNGTVNDFELSSGGPSAVVSGSDVHNHGEMQEEFDPAVEHPEPPSPSHLHDPEVNRCLQEPLLCRESTPTSIPAMLRDLYCGAACRTSTDALWIVIHALLMEVGFRPVENIGLSLAEDWNTKGFYRQDYQHLFVTIPHNCSVIAVPMGPKLVVHGTARGEPALRTDSHQVTTSDFVDDPIEDKDACLVFKNLERLSGDIKDLVCQPLLSHLSDMCGFPVTLGLLSLSYELKLKVLSYLPATCLVKMAQVCREYSVVCKDPYLWRRLYLRDFGRYGDVSLNKDWYRLYKEEYARWKERRRVSRHRQVFTGIPPWLNPPPNHLWPPLPQPFGGNIIGGDYDLNPDFASSIPHPMGLGRRPPGPVLPFGPLGPRPRFDDPFGPGATPFGPTGVPFGPNNMGPGAGPPGQHYTSLSGGTPSRLTRPSPFTSLGGRRL